MSQDATHIGKVATIVVPVSDQAAALGFYVEALGMAKVSDFTYPTGERWLEVSPAEGSANLCLVLSRPERPAGIETGVVLHSSDVLADSAALRAQGVDVDERPLPEGDVVWWSGAPLAGVPTQVRLHDRRQLVPRRRSAVASLASSGWRHRARQHPRRSSRWPGF